MQRLLHQLYQLKLTIVALLIAASGVGLLVLARWGQAGGGPSWLNALPLGELGSTFVVTGLIGTIFDYATSTARDRRDDERLRRLLSESAPAFTDAVVQGFAVRPDDLKRVATPDLLDSIASNALGLRLGDAPFAGEVYAQLIDNVVRAPERWYDVDVRIRLSSIDERNTAGVPRFAVTVTWEYSTIPSSPVRRFACTSSREEFHELVSEIPSTSTWFMTPRPGLDPSDRASFELLQFSVDGEERNIRRSARKAGQTYSVQLGDEVMRQQKPVRIRHVYRSVTAQSGHLLLLAIAQPTKGLSLSLDYTDTDITTMRVTDLVSSATRPRVARLPEETAAREVTMDVPGWILPQAEITFVWTLVSETAVAAKGPSGSPPARPRAA